MRRCSQQLWATLATDLLQPHTTPHKNQVQRACPPSPSSLWGPPKDTRELCLRFLLSEVTKPPESISGMWRPDSLSSLSSQSEVHKTALPVSHSYSNIGPHASQMELAGGIWDAFFAQDVKVDGEIKERLLTQSWAPLAGALYMHREWLACSESRLPAERKAMKAIFSVPRFSCL